MAGVCPTKGGTSILLVIVLSACATREGEPTSRPLTQPGADTRLAQAATAPLSDLNIVHAPIPPVMSAAQKAPYGAPAEVQALDAALGADLDTPATASNPA